ncbi:MAG: site-specific DNA-methyltransferase [Tepidisphaera sp.]
MATKKYDDLTRDEMVRLLEARDRRDATRFGLVWEANEIERDKALNSDFVAMDLDEKLSCGLGAGKDGPWKNLIIEGDNFDALRYLKMTFAGRVKCIYIDPPYNTGNKDFVYNDHYVDKEDLWRHSTWCEFIHQRLVLAKELLSENGVIFVSIDDNEIHTLGMLMQRVFGESNFIANIVWQKRTSPDARIDLGPAHDYVVVFARAKQQVQFGTMSLSDKQKAAYKNPDNDPRGPWVSSDFTAQGYRPNQMYKIKTPGGAIYEPPAGVCWKNVEPTFLQLVKDKRIWFGKDGKAMPRRKTFLSETEGIKSWTWWPNTEVGHNQEAKKEMLDVLPESADEAFSTPKPVRLVQRIVEMTTSGGDIVLDFFAGSGTTAHAVHKLNKEDGGSRRVILVSSTEATEDEPKKNLCRDVCAERVRRVIKGYGKGDSKVEGLGGDFAYLRTRRIPIGELTEIEHDQVWTALQLTHCPTVGSFDDKAPFMTAETEEEGGTLFYVPSLKAANTRALVKAVKDARSAVLYTWQPDLARLRLKNANNVQIEAVPQVLARRFGVRGLWGGGGI